MRFYTEMSDQNIHFLRQTTIRFYKYDKGMSHQNFLYFCDKNPDKE